MQQTRDWNVWPGRDQEPGAGTRVALLLWWRQNTWHRGNTRAVLSYPELSWPSMQMSSGARMQCAACERCPRPAPRSCHLSVGPRGARSPHPAHRDARREGCTRVVIFARIFGNTPVIHLHYLQDKSDILDTRTICAHAIWWTIEWFRWDRGDFHNSRFSTEMEDIFLGRTVNLGGGGCRLILTQAILRELFLLHLFEAKKSFYHATKCIATLYFPCRIVSGYLGYHTPLLSRMSYARSRLNS